MKDTEKSWLKHYPEGVRSEINPDEYRSLAQLMGQACSKFADKTAIVCLGEELRYRELEDRANRFAKYLQHVVGLNKGDRLAIMLPNLFEFPIVFYAAQKIGVICVNTNPQYTAREMKHQFNDSGCKALVILDIFCGELQKIIADTNIRSVVTVGVGDNCSPIKRTIINTVIRLKGLKPEHDLHVTSFKEALRLGGFGPVDAVHCDPEDVAVLQYTGGTTGVSKGAMLTHRNIIANVVQNTEWASQHITDGQETVLAVLPLYHIYALTVNFLSFLASGQRMILVPKPIPIKNTVKPFTKYDITILSGVNTLFNEMVHDKKFQKIKPRQLKCALAGGMALQNTVAEQWEKTTGTPAVEGYGLTEASPVTHCNPLDGEHRMGTIGIPLPSTDAKVVNPDGEEVSPGEVGELIVRGPQIMKGYWQREDETKKVIRDGWLWTGDMASCDEDGFFRIVDRKKDMIIVSGFNVYPNEVEEVIAAHPKVKEVAVVGIPDAKSGERVKAFIAPSDDSLTEEELNEFCSAELAAYKRPKFWEFMPELPKSTVGKILRRELRDHGAAASASPIHEAS